jgi:hypothetical protein
MYHPDSKELEEVVAGDEDRFRVVTQVGCTARFASFNEAAKTERIGLRRLVLRPRSS